MSFEIDQYELDYDEQPPTPNNNNSNNNNNANGIGLPAAMDEYYGPALPPGFLLDESAPEDPTQVHSAFVHSSSTIGSRIPANFGRPSTSVNQTNDSSSPLPSLCPADMIASATNGGTLARFSFMELPAGYDEDVDFNNSTSTSTASHRENGACFNEDSAHSAPSPPVIGPTLSSNFLPTTRNAIRCEESVDCQDSSSADDNPIGPTLPRFDRDRPLNIPNERNGGQSDGEDASFYGPTLPPSVPSFSSNYNAKNDENIVALCESDGDDSVVVGPIMPPCLDNRADISSNSKQVDEEDEIVGPTLSPGNCDEHDNEYYYRLMELQERKSAASSASRREEWMTELPQTLRQSYGLSAKSAFSASSGISTGQADRARSEWTHTPNDNSKNSTRSAAASGFASFNLNQRVPIMNKVSTVPTTSRQIPSTSAATVQGGESLMEIHQRKRKLSHITDSSVGERVPFNRDFDMEVHGLSKMSAEEAKNRAGSLVSRFESGTSKRYL